MEVCLAGLVAGGKSGVPRYAATLARALDEVAGEFGELRLRLLTTPSGAEAVGAQTIDVSVPRLGASALDRGPVRLVLEQLLLAAPRAELVHFFDLSAPLLRPGLRFTTTIHDASVAYSFRRARTYKRHLWPLALRRAERVVAVSQFAADEAVRHFGTPAEKLTVIHSGPGFGSSGTIAAPRWDGPFFLYVGNLHESKNLPFLVRAFAASGTTGTLVLAGRPDQGIEQLREEVSRSPARDRVAIAEDVGDAELEGLYRSATALVLPSRYEGFGFTPLEAMARGCPVLASDIPPLREISGSGALLAPLDDEPAWSDALGRLESDEGLRVELRRKGELTVARYSWAETARALCRLLLEVGRR
jgi:glycosyltransferase involved in cell wall biosynthesis